MRLAKGPDHSQDALSLVCVSQKFEKQDDVVYLRPLVQPGDEVTAIQDGAFPSLIPPLAVSRRMPVCPGAMLEQRLCSVLDTSLHAWQSGRRS